MVDTEASSNISGRSSRIGGHGNQPGGGDGLASGLMGIRMPVLDGIEATRLLAAEGCPTRVLVLTSPAGSRR